MASSPPHILIIGAGITGLVLAQALRKRHAADSPAAPPPFSIFERDPNPTHRGAGWGLTIHWALPDFEALLPADLLARLPETFVDNAAVAEGLTGNFLLFDLQNGAERYRVPPNTRIRVSRERLRRLLMDGLDIQWSKTIAGIDTTTPGAVTASFTDGTTATGTHLIGADGSRSTVRTLLAPSPENHVLPVRLLGASVPYSSTRCAPIRDVDPFFFQASDPATDAFFWFSFLSVPADPKEDRVCQILVSWPYRKGFLGREEPVDIPAREDRVAWMKEVTKGWVEPFRSIVADIPEGTEVKSLALEDWVPAAEGFDSRDGRVTLIGDAAHAMTMYRGEAANHGIADVASLMRELFAETDANTKGPIERYTAEMLPRARVAVLNSRRACMDAHDHEKINETSPLVSRRVIVLE
ncbi:hypothetical protein O988_08460 [Pseudogymnoascus sp. VKM F-3808]|nr:hypothetical protein O988_08460 [Pseudogymnoascus sp. VKM F-3808]